MYMFVCNIRYTIMETYNVVLVIYVLLQVRPELVNPSETARFSGSLKKAFGSNGAPVSWSVLTHMVYEHFVFFSLPWPFFYVFFFLSFHFSLCALSVFGV